MVSIQVLNYFGELIWCFNTHTTPLKRFVLGVFVPLDGQTHLTRLKTYLKPFYKVDCSQISKNAIERITSNNPKLKVQVFFAPESPPAVAVPMRSFLRCPIRFSCTIL